MRLLRSVTVVVLLISAAAAVPAAAAPEGQVTWGVHISLAPTWFDPAETPGIVTPFMVLYGLHDAMLKALPGNPLAPALAVARLHATDLHEAVLARAGDVEVTGRVVPDLGDDRVRRQRSRRRRHDHAPGQQAQGGDQKASHAFDQRGAIVRITAV